MAAVPILSLRRYSYAYAEAGDYILRGINLDIFPGQCHCISGPTGCGKTTLLLAVRGLLPPGRRSGQLVVNAVSGVDKARPPGIVLQNPQLQLMGVGLGADVAFGLENHCIPPGEMPRRVHQALVRSGLNQPLATPVLNLSMGQQYRACLAGVLVISAPIVMLDEPAAQLDPQGLAQLNRVIENLKADGKAVLVCDHRPEAFAEVTDHYWHLARDGRLSAGGIAGIPNPGRDNASACRSHPREIASASGGPSQSDERVDRQEEDGPVVIRVQGLSLACREMDRSEAQLSFRVVQGERLAVTGPNGAGKTTLIKCLTGMARPGAGSIEIFGETPEPRNLRGLVGVLFQNPGKQLFDTTVFDEVAFAANRRLGPGAARSEVVNTLLKHLGIEALAGRSPHSLSYGQKHLVGLASVLAGEPRVLLLDDPMAGLDEDNVRRVMRLLAHVNRTAGTTILWTSHDPDALAGWAHRSVRLESNSTNSGCAASAPGKASGTAAFYPLPAGIALAIGIVLSMTAFAARSPGWLAALTGINLLILWLGCPKPMVVLRRSAKLFVWQAVIITLLYGLRFGWSSGLIPGLRVSWQLFLAFWPGLVFMAAASATAITQALSRVLPDQTAFVVATCLRFMPMLLAEMSSIRQVQVLRGARLLRGDLNKPRYWPDWLHCLLVPTLVRTLGLAAEIAQAATVRDFGIHDHRTHWPGEAT